MNARSLAQTLLKALLLCALLIAPFAASAQSEELRATVRAKLMEDPRSQQMSEADFNAVVDILTTEASKEGLTARDIVWQPEEPGSVVIAEDQCADILCRMNVAFGFEGEDMTIPIALGASSALLILIIGALIKLHHRHEAAPLSGVPPITTP